ncbi:MAG: crossover junction endodeoxyribonuclease RuvC [Fusobacteriaceae bacterium]
MSTKINYIAWESKIQKSKSGHVYKVESYLGEKSSKHMYRVRFVIDGMVKTVPYEQVRGNTVTYSFTKPKVNPTKAIKKTSKSSYSGLIDKHNLKVFALDMATQKTGYAGFNSDVIVEYGTISKTGTDKFQRIKKMVDEIMYHIDKGGYNYVVIEDIFLKSDRSKNVTTLIALANIQGALVYHLSKKNIRFELVSASTWKSALGMLKRRADGKESAIEYVENLMGKRLGEDESEAIAIGIYFLKNRVKWEI